MMKQNYRELGYVRVNTGNMGKTKAFASEVFGLQLGESDEDNLRFRSDHRNYSICYSAGKSADAVALTVGSFDALEHAETQLAQWSPVRLSDAECLTRQIKAGLAVVAPNGLAVELVWRPLVSGWRYHGPRDAGIVGLQSVQMACTDMAANESFWVQGIGLQVSDWVGDAAFLQIDESHHGISLYPSDHDGLLGVVWAVEALNNVMQGWYNFQSHQVPIVHGPGRHSASDAIFVTAKGPDGIFYSYAAETDTGAHIAARGPRQFANTNLSHCVWGSPCSAPEFKGGDRND